MRFSDFFSIHAKLSKSFENWDFILTFDTEARVLQPLASPRSEGPETDSLRQRTGPHHRRLASLAKRAFDLVGCLLLLPLLFVPLLAIAIAVKLTSKGPILYWSDRIGRDNRTFRMPKFRSMKLNTPEVATHLLRDPDFHMTAIGPFIRKTSLDELPQIYSILKGELSFVGPRPALYNQHDLVALRTERGVHKLVPGLTGWAQVNGRDNIPIPVKVAFDFEYLQKNTIFFDLRILVLTLMKVLRGDGITH